MDELISARKILDTMKEGTTFLCLRDLAKYSGFQKASNPSFKAGFNYLVAKGVLKLQQSGWRSEKRGGDNHPKTVILTANLYEIVDSEFCVDLNAVEKLPEFSLVGLPSRLKKKRLSEKRKQKYRDCQDCVHNPVAYLTAEKIPVCEKHWGYLAGSSIEW